MLNAQSSCANCAVYNNDIEELKRSLDLHGLSDSQAWALGHDLLCEATRINPDCIVNFLYGPGIEATSESQGASEAPLTWEGEPLRCPVGTSSKELMSSLLLPHSQTKRQSRDYLAPLRIAALLNDTEITEVVLDYISRNKSPPPCDNSMSNLETIRSLARSNRNVHEISDDSLTMLDPAVLLAKTEIMIKVCLNPLYFNKPQLYKSAEENKAESIESQLKYHAFVDIKSHADLTPLHKAAQLGHTESAEILIDQGADINCVCALALNTLVRAAVEGNKERLIDLLLRAGMAIDASMQNGDSLLELANERGNLKVVKLLTNNFGDIDALHKEKNILRLAVESQHLQLIEKMIVDCSNSTRPTGETQSKILQDLRRLGFGVNPKDTKNCNLLHEAVRGGHSKIVEYLINLGADINAESTLENNATPLLIAVKHMHTKIARLLMRRKAYVNVKDADGKTPLHYAVENMRHKQPNMAFPYDSMGAVSGIKGYLEDRLVYLNERISGTTAGHRFIDFLLEHGANVNAVAVDMETPLHSAARHGDDKIVKRLLDQGAKINAKRTDGATALHVAASRHVEGTAVKIIKVLLDEGAKIDARQTNGATALHIATMEGRIGTIRVLLDHDSDINILCNDGKTPLDYAISSGLKRLGGFTGVVKILLEHIVKMIALNRWVCDRNVRAANRFDVFKHNYEGCKLEVERMKQQKINASHISYYDLLTKGMNLLALYARNKDIVDALEAGIHTESFSLYSAMIDQRFKSGLKRASLLDLSVKSLTFLSGYPLSLNSIIELFDYLSNEDLENLIIASACEESDN